MVRENHSLNLPSPVPWLLLGVLVISYSFSACSDEEEAARDAAGTRDALGADSTHDRGPRDGTSGGDAADFRDKGPPRCTGCLKEGEACSWHVECSNRRCVDGYCCKEECKAACMSCGVSGKEGKCSLVPGGKTTRGCGKGFACDGKGQCRLADGEVCDKAEICASGHCKDEVCCDTACTTPCMLCSTGKCSAVKGKADTPECSGSKSCSASGQCTLANGQKCSSGMACASGQCKDGVCCDTACTTPCMSCSTGKCLAVKGKEDKPECSGSKTCSVIGQCKLVNGQKCSTDMVCVTGYCKDGVCCDTACTTPCMSCSTGTCLAVKGKADTPECAGSKSCNTSGVCQGKSGVKCSTVSDCFSGHCKDGVCCDKACTTPCMSCATGKCLAVKGQVDTPECSGTKSCDASAQCKLVNGQICSSSTACASGQCKDGACCDTACATPCMSCTTGTCSAVTGKEDSPECSGTKICDTSGKCQSKLANGQKCSSGSVCLSGKCKDGVCCDTACTTPCMLCITGKCSLVKGNSDWPECWNSMSCDASGKCKPANGQKCTSSAACASGLCKDGVCCDTACTTPCMSCASGKCSAVQGKADIPECSGSKSCSASGKCMLANGQKCSSGAACASGHCKDGACCDTACTTPCMSCATGKCMAVKGKSDKPECTGSLSCDSVGLCMVSVKPGTFQMGSPSSEKCRGSDETQHQVTLTGKFEIMNTEVTQEQYKAVMGLTPSYFSSCGGACPVAPVNWHEAAAYANALSAQAGKALCYWCSGSGKSVQCGENYAGAKIYTCPGYRLPTEAEWEYAYRAGTSTALYNGGSLTSCFSDSNVDKIMWYYYNSNNTTHPAGQKTPNAWGLYDMAGNVEEWCHDWYGSYPSSSVTDPVGTKTSYPLGYIRVSRGGNWWSLADSARAAYRWYYLPDGSLSYNYVGFRLVRSVP